MTIFVPILLNHQRVLIFSMKYGKVLTKYKKALLFPGIKMNINVTAIREFYTWFQSITGIISRSPEGVLTYP